jgi:hypothetical protein
VSFNVRNVHVNFHSSSYKTFISMLKCIVHWEIRPSHSLSSPDILFVVRRLYRDKLILSDIINLILSVFSKPGAKKLLYSHDLYYYHDGMY